MKRQIIITGIVCIIIAFMSFWMGIHLDTSIQDFCYDRYHDDSFLDNFVGDEPAMLKTCIDNDKYPDGYLECLYSEGTYEQIKFSTSCGWMSRDYFNLMFQVALTYAIPIAFIYVIISLWYSEYRRRKKKK